MNILQSLQLVFLEYFILGSDIDAQTTDEISANWDVNDHESGLELCEWAVGMYKVYSNFYKININLTFFYYLND